MVKDTAVQNERNKLTFSARRICLFYRLVILQIGKTIKTMRNDVMISGRLGIGELWR